MTLATWLESVGRYDVQPCKVTINGTTYDGCRYLQDYEPVPGARCQEPYTVEAFYLLADSLPACYRRSSHVAFTLEGDAREWYVGGYSGRLARTPAERRHLKAFRACYGMNTEEHRARYEPYGPYFQLFPWATEHGRIDQHEERPYLRVPITVEECEEETPTAPACCIIGCGEPGTVPYHQWHMCEGHMATTTGQEG